MNNLHFIFRFSVSNIKKNGRLFLPHVLSGSGFVAVFYIFLALSMDERLHGMRGGAYIPAVMKLGTYIMEILSVILIFYTDSFLMKQRRSEYGLYSVLGLERKHIGRLMFTEHIISALCAIFPGLLAGMILYKFFTLLICNILNIDSILGFYVSVEPVLHTAAFFAVVYAAAFAFNRIQLARLRVVELLHSANAGEREPKVRWVFLLAGILALGAGYGMALTCRSPLAAINEIFIAVIFVIIGTYCLFVAGTVALLKALKNSPRYYYKPNHMIAVSGLLYRMKQNAVGLASICILATGVLVMLSTTISLYAGIVDSVDMMYPHDLVVSGDYGTSSGRDTGEELAPVLAETVQQSAEKCGLTVGEVQIRNYLIMICGYEDGVFFMDRDKALWDKSCALVLITEEEYNRLTGETLSLADGEAALCAMSKQPDVYPDGAFTLGGDRYRTAQTLKEFPVSVSGYEIFSTYGVVLKDKSVLNNIMQSEYGESASAMRHEVVVDFADSDAALNEYAGVIYSDISDVLDEAVRADGEATGALDTRFDLKAHELDYMYGMCGSLLFLGLLLGFVFLFATAVIIYYKQISEGYEDRERYQIMEKVGMSRAEIKRSVNSQILLVFFLPLVVAAVHISVAFPILYKLLQIFVLPNIGLFVGCTGICLVLFSVVYTVIYRATAGVYFRIVR